MEDLHGLLNDHLEETFCCFLDEDSRKLAAADAAAQVWGGMPVPRCSGHGSYPPAS